MEAYLRNSCTVEKSISRKWCATGFLKRAFSAEILLGTLLA